MKHNLNEVKRMQQLAGVINESQLNEADHLSEVRQLVRKIINEGVIKSGVKEMWDAVIDALNNRRTVTVDDVKIKTNKYRLALIGVDGKVYRIQSPEYLSNPERIKIEDANGEMKSPVITFYSDDEISQKAKDYMDRTGGKFMGPESYIDPESMFYRGGD